MGLGRIDDPNEIERGAINKFHGEEELSSFAVLICVLAREIDGNDVRVAECCDSLCFSSQTFGPPEPRPSRTGPSTLITRSRFSN